MSLSTCIVSQSVPVCRTLYRILGQAKRDTGRVKVTFSGVKIKRFPNGDLEFRMADTRHDGSLWRLTRSRLLAEKLNVEEEVVLNSCP